jgi:hypothetical protein
MAASVVDFQDPVGHASRIIQLLVFISSLKIFGRPISSIVGIFSDKSLDTIMTVFCCLDIFILKRLQP